MTDYRKYINALRKCAKEHDNDITLTGYIIVSDLCRDTANLLELLKQEPCKDAISREDIEECKELMTDITGDTVYAVRMSDIRQLSSVKPKEPKMGYWRPIYQGDEIINYRCSECEFGNTFGKSTWGMNYCPYCGAKMKSEEKENG